MGPFELLFWIIIGLLGLLAVLGAVGYVQAKRRAARGEPDPDEPAEVLSQKTVDNVHDLNDRFNRARYMDKDGR